MVLGLLAIAAIPTVIGVSEGISSQSKESNPETSSKTEAERMRKFNLQCFCGAQNRKAGEIDGGKVVLREDKVWIIPRRMTGAEKSGHPFEGFYIGYPDPDRPKPPPLGLVSTISVEPPMLNWIYVDKTTREVKYGNRTQSKAHVVGSWGSEAGEEGGAGGVTLEGGEGAVAVETEAGWEVRWEDENGNVGVEEKRALTISLERKFLELTEEEKSGKNEEAGKDEEVEKRTDKKVELTNTTFERSKKTTRQQEKVDKETVGDRKIKDSEPRLEIRGKTVEKPLKDR